MMTTKQVRPKIANTVTTSTVRDNQIESGPIDVLSAKYAGEHLLRIQFSDYSEKVVNFESFLSTAQHPEIRKYLEMNRFQQFGIRDGNVVWGDYDLIFPIADLYKGSV